MTKVSLFGILDFYIGICLIFGFYYLALIIYCLCAFAVNFFLIHNKQDQK